MSADVSCYEVCGHAVELAKGTEAEETVREPQMTCAGLRCGGHNLWRSHFGVDEHPFVIYFDVHQGYRILTHRHASDLAAWDLQCMDLHQLGMSDDNIYIYVCIYVYIYIYMYIYIHVYIYISASQPLLGGWTSCHILRP